MAQMIRESRKRNKDGSVSLHYKALLPTKHFGFTMLVAWHKFDAYDRLKLVECTKIEISKLPFAKLETVVQALSNAEREQRVFNFMKEDEVTIPYTDYARRIIRAAAKEWRKTHRKRERLKV